MAWMAYLVICTVAADQPNGWRPGGYPGADPVPPFPAKTAPGPGRLHAASGRTRVQSHDHHTTSRNRESDRRRFLVDADADAQHSRRSVHPDTSSGSP